MMSGKEGSDPSPGESMLEGDIHNLIQENAPLRHEVVGQTLEALQTGGIGARLPIAQKAVEASRAATASAVGDITRQVAAAGLGRSSYGNTLKANTILQGTLGTAAIPTDIASQFISIAPTLTTGLGGQAIQGALGQGQLYNQRAGILAQQDIAKGQQNTQMMTSLMGAGAMAAFA